MPRYEKANKGKSLIRKIERGGGGVNRDLCNRVQGKRWMELGKGMRG